MNQNCNSALDSAVIPGETFFSRERGETETMTETETETETESKQLNP
jgi:hypothetical protein